VATRTLDFGGLDERVRLAPAVSVGLLQQIVEAFPRLSSARQRRLATDIDRFVEAGSWTDLALGLVRLELPTWRIRRLACEGGEWLCSLSRQPHLPLGLDETADGTEGACRGNPHQRGPTGRPCPCSLDRPHVGNSDLLRQLCLNVSYRGAGYRPLCLAYEAEARSISNSYLIKRRLRTNRKKRRR
jgi:hypothetical protein